MLERRYSAFDQLGFQATIQGLVDEIRCLYLEDGAPWVIGYSGGKDSGATASLVWLALAGLPPERRHKTVHVISTNTLVENPIVVSWVDGSLDAMRRAAAAQGLPIEVDRLTPELKDSFWVCLIGKGYPAPRVLFRWCTERLKIRPSNKFITDQIAARGEAILVLGTRKAESAARARTMARLEQERVRDRLSPNASLKGSLVYSPIEDWSNDDVWMFLMQIKNPWGWSNKDLLTMYKGASADGECPLVVDTGTPSCGSSRFGCWVCTMVDQDKSMQAMISNDEEKDWMLPLLELRNALDVEQDRHLRDFRRMNGRVQLMGEGADVRPIPGPYHQQARADWLHRLLEAQTWIRKNGPDSVRGIELISMDELREIRRIWVTEKHEIEDLLPGIYEKATGSPYPDETSYDIGYGREDLALLREACGGDEHLYKLTRDLLAIESEVRSQGRRAKLFPKLGDVFQRYLYETQEEAVAALAPRRRGQLPLFGLPAPKNAPTDDDRRKTLQERADAALERWSAMTSKP